MKVLVPIDVESLSDKKAAVDAILDNAWPDDAEFYLFNVVEDDNPGRCTRPECASRCRCLEPRITALCDMMRSLETRMPHTNFYVEVTRGNLADKVSSWIDQRPSSTVLTTRPIPQLRKPKPHAAHGLVAGLVILAASVALACGFTAFNAHPAGGFVVVPPVVPVSPPVAVQTPVYRKESDQQLKYELNARMGEACLDAQDYWRAVLFYKSALNSWQQLHGTQAQLSAITGGLTVAYGELHQYEKAIGFAKQSVAAALAEQPKDMIDVSVAYNNLGGLYKLSGRFALAQDAYEQAMKFAPVDSVGDRLRAATIEMDMAENLARLNKVPKALVAYKHALRIFKQEIPNNNDVVKDLEERIRLLQHQTPVVK